MVLPKRKVESSLKVKGFQVHQGDHHYFTYITLDGVRTHIFTKTSHSRRPDSIPTPLLSQMARQCKLTLSQFRELIQCGIDQKEYENLLIQQKIIATPK